jgi:hypothetical protein
MTRNVPISSFNVAKLMILVIVVMPSITIAPKETSSLSPVQSATLSKTSQMNASTAKLLLVIRFAHNARFGLQWIYFTAMAVVFGEFFYIIATN